jgi:hypothetical protein
MKIWHFNGSFEMSPWCGIGTSVQPCIYILKIHTKTLHWQSCHMVMVFKEPTVELSKLLDHA